MVFGYGTLKKPSVRSKIFGDDPGVSTHKIDGYEKENCGEEFTTLIESKDNSVHGVLLRLSGEQIKKLDAWEEKYERKKIGDIEGQPLYAYFMNQELQTSTP